MDFPAGAPQQQDVNTVEQDSDIEGIEEDIDGSKTAEEVQKNQTKRKRQVMRILQKFTLSDMQYLTYKVALDLSKITSQYFNNLLR